MKMKYSMLPVMVLLSLFQLRAMAPGQTYNAEEGKESIYYSIPENATPVALSFEEYMSLVMTRNHGLAAERFRVPVAEAETKAAKVTPDPQLSFEGAEDLYSIELGYTIEFGRKRGARIAYARTFAEMEKCETEIFETELRLAAAEAYIEAIAEAELLNVKKSSFEYMLQLSGSDSIRYRAGEITENEARQSALEANTLLGEVYEQEGAYLSSLAVLGYFTGISSNTVLMPVGDVKTRLENASLDYLLDKGQSHRIENELALRGIELARRELAIANSERKPDVDVFIGYERDWKGFVNTRKMLKGGVTIPLQFSAANKGSVRAAGFAVEMERRNELNVRAGIETEIVQAYHVYNASLKTYEYFRSGIMDQARKVLDGAVYSYMAGETDLLEVLIAQRTYNETREQFIESRKNAQSATVTLLFACGLL